MRVFCCALAGEDTGQTAGLCWSEIIWSIFLTARLQCPQCPLLTPVHCELNKKSHVRKCWIQSPSTELQTAAELDIYHLYSPLPLLKQTTALLLRNKMADFLLSEFYCLENDSICTPNINK